MGHYADTSEHGLNLVSELMSKTLRGWFGTQDYKINEKS